MRRIVERIRKNLLKNPQIFFCLFVLLFYITIMFVLRHVFPAAGDIAISQVRWWDYLNEKGFKGISTINQDIGADYTNIWYFIIVLFCKIGLYPTISLEVCIKLMAILGSIISGIAVYFIVKNFTQKESWKPVIAFCITLFSSTLFLDILKTNLPDSLYIAPVLFALLAIIKHKPIIAWFLVGVAMQFKMMAIYILPLFAMLYILEFNKNKAKDILAPLSILPGFILPAIPGWISGLNLYESVFGTIFSRSGDGLSRFGIGGVLFDPNWKWLPTVDSDPKGAVLFGYLMIILIFLVIFAMIMNIKNKQKQKIQMGNLLIISPLVMFMFMPAQHEGYFSLAVIFALIISTISFSKRNWVLFGYLSFVHFSFVMNFTFIGMPNNYLIICAIGYLFISILKETKIFDRIKNEKVDYTQI